MFEGMRVVEISARGAAALAGAYFADWGAEVLTLEPASGTPLRFEPPYYEVGGEQKSGLWSWLSLGKSILKIQAGGQTTTDQARALCEGADVLLLESDLCESVLGLQPAEVRGVFEGKTTCVLFAPFATDGPYAKYLASDLGLCALGGWMTTIWLGAPGRVPLHPGIDMTARYAGVFGFVAALIALRHLEQGGQPQFVDLSLQAVATHGLVAPWLVKSMLGVEQERNGARWPSVAMKCADGYVGCSPLTATHWEMVCHMMGMSDVLEEPGGRLPSYRAEHGVELHERVKPWLAHRTRLEIFEEAQTWRIPSAPVESVAERLVCPQLEARGFWRSTNINGRAVKVPRMPILIDGGKPHERHGVSESEEDSGNAASSAAAKASKPAPGTPPGRPLEGIRVLDLTWFWAGPFATMLLGALGADVLKIESVQRPDPYRMGMAPAGSERLWERSAYWNDTNCNKRGVTLDLTQPAGNEVFRRLAAKADVVISNFSNRVSGIL